MKHVKAVARTDILKNVECKLFERVDEFVTENKQNTLMYVFIINREDDTFLYDVQAKGPKIVYSADYSNVKTLASFKNRISKKLFEEDVVFCSYKLIHRTSKDDLEVTEFVDIVKNKFDSLEDHEHLDIDIFKPQTYTKMMICKNECKYQFNVLVDAVSDYDNFFEEERPPVYRDNRFSKSKCVVLSHVRHIAKTVDPYAYIDTYVSTCSYTNLLNLKRKMRYNNIVVKETEEVKMDRLRYDNVRSRDELNEEIMAAAWHPSRFVEWCLSDDERSEIIGDFA